ncbi:MAG: ROK family protein [Opitutaceae bacterium]|nr:ROK family protein [Opitutaceae bacterium]
MDTIIKPILDPGFTPSTIWNQDYREQIAASSNPVAVTLALMRPDETCSLYRIQILPLVEENEKRTLRYLERLLKFLLWQRGASNVLISGCDPLVEKLSAIYSENGARSFDYHFFGGKVYDHPLEFKQCEEADLPQPNEQSIRMGYNLDGCRIGFDLGGSDRKCAAVIDGEVVFSEEVEWSPYFESDPSYHIDGIKDTLKRAAAHLPRVDAIGGSAAGVYVNNEVRVGSLFRGVSPDDFDSKVRRIFFDLKKEWQNVPFEVVNDGEVTALAGSMSMGENAVLGISMGTSLAAGYITDEGSITPWLNELAFVPVDYREDAPADEWSGDLGCGAQYLTQQAVARLAPLAGIDFPAGTPFPEQLIEVQRLMAEGDERAANIYSTIGTYLGYSIAHFSEFYTFRKILLLGRVTSGQGGTVIIEKARETLDALFPELSAEIEFVTPSETEKRHGQAVAAASLPFLT